MKTLSIRIDRPSTTFPGFQVRKSPQAKSRRAKGEFRGTVLIADDHDLYRTALVQVLRRYLKINRILEAVSFAEVLEHLKQENPTLAIVDLGMPGLSSPKDIARMRLLRPDALVVVLSASDRRKDILEALSAGVHGYIVKSERTDQLIGRLRHILSGEVYVPPILAELPSHAEVTLTIRQRQVLKGVVEGKANRQIANALSIAEGTVKLHLAALFRVLGATNRAHVAALGKHLVDRNGEEKRGTG
jgi:DNA-binding NarL/FixJ family response regulator